jgi:hypothetical protein
MNGSDSIEELDRYLSREYEPFGKDTVHKILATTVEHKGHLKRERESSKILSAIMLRAHLISNLSPSFIENALISGTSLTDAEVKRPFDDLTAEREAGIRAQLLADNIYFTEDMAVVRRVLGLPSEGIKEVPVTEIPNEYSYWLENGPPDVRLLSNLWEMIHIAKVEKKQYNGPELPGFIPGFLKDYLSEDQPVSNLSESPEWLDRVPRFPWGRPLTYRDNFPLDRYLGVMLWDYRLPPRLWGRLRTYLFSNRQEDLLPQSGDPLEGTGLNVNFDFAEAKFRSTLTVTIQGVDAFTTEKEFTDIFRYYIIPQQNSWRRDLAKIYFNQEHGHFPNMEEYKKLNLPRRAKRPFTKPFNYLDLWKRMKKTGASVDKMLNELDNDLERRNTQRSLKRLDQLMRPAR